MIKLAGKIDARPDAVTRRLDRASRRWLYRAGSYVRTAARRSIRKRARPVASPVGKAPYSHPSKRGGTYRLRESIAFEVDRRRTMCVVGPRASVVGKAGRAHELGGRYRGQRYDRRPFMRPAAEASAEKLQEFWKNAMNRR